MTHNSRRGVLLLAIALLLPACGVGSGNGTLTPTVAPAAPTSITPRSGNGRVSLSWTASPAATSYTVKRSTSSSGLYVPVADVVGTTLVDTGLTNTTAYYYRISASNAFGTSGDSVEVRAVPGIRPKLLASGGRHTLLFLEDDTFWSVGLNDYSQLGPGAGPIQGSTIAVPAADFQDVIGLAANGHTSLAIRADGTVWAWGDNRDGVLGVPPSSLPVRSSAAPIPGLDSIISVDLGYSFALALRSDGTVWSWGLNDVGQLGRSKGQQYSETPAPVPNLTDVIAIAAGYSHSLALKSDGTVWAWGTNNTGELANVTANTGPGRVFNVAKIASIAAAQETSYAVDTEGIVWAWGNNFAQQLGFKSIIIGPVVNPTPSSETRRVVSVGAGYRFAAFLHADGTVAVWGSNSSGQFGDGTIGGPDGNVTEVPGLSGVASIFVREASCFAVRNDGSLWAWGSGTSGNLGSGIGIYQVTPRQLSGTTDIALFGCGLAHGLLTLPDTSTWSWGFNFQGSLGNGTSLNSSVRTQVVLQGPFLDPLKGVTSLAGGDYHNLARVNGGTVYSWGLNSDGQLGNGSTTPANKAGLIPGLTGVASVAAGGDNSYALMNDGTVKAWGAGYLGNNAAPGSTTPVAVSVLTNAKAVVAGHFHTHALRTDGSVWSWGGNIHGNLGIGSASNSLVPVPNPTLSNVVSIAAGYDHGVVAKADGTVWCWGDNWAKQLGDPALSNSNVPIQVPSLSGVIAVAAGADHCVALRNDGTVWCWGSNYAAELADPVVVDSAVPLQVPGITDAKAIWAGGARTFVQRTDGTVWGWGANGWGALGIGTDGYVRSPMEVTR